MLSPRQERLLELSQQPLLPLSHVQYLHQLKSQGVEPRVIYDIGSCVLHWYNVASQVWPAAQFYVMDAMDSAEFLYQQNNLPYNIGVLSNSDRKTVTFWQNDYHPGGNSYYRENPEINHEVDQYFNESHKRILECSTLDTVISRLGWPVPDFVKMDVQGAEQDVLLGMTNTLPHVQHLILELQNVEYNKGAPLSHQVVSWLAGQGFECTTPLFSNNGADGDYHFTRKTA